MARLIRLEIRKLIKPVALVTVLLSVLLSVLSCTVFQQGHSLFAKLDKWELGFEFLGLLFPLFVALPVCWQLYYERRDRFLVYTLPRVPAKRYIAAKYTACAVCAFAVIFIPLMLSALTALYVAPDPRYGYNTEDMYNPPWTHMLKTLYTSRPILYALLISGWKGLIGVLSMTLGFVLALYGSNIFVILTGPFVYAILDHFLWGLGPYYSLIGAFNPEAFAKAARPLRFIWGPIQALLFCALTALFYAKVKKRRVYPL